MLDASVLGPGSLIGIVRFHEGGDVAGAMAALVRGGIEQVEVTIDTPGALAAVAAAADEGRTVGVGTIVDSEQVRAAADAGARFVVSPGLVPEVIETALGLGLEPMPGVFTATEILTAAAAGARVMKLFPASCGGPVLPECPARPFPHDRPHPDRRCPDRGSPGLPEGGCDGDRARKRSRRARRTAVGRRPGLDRSPGRPRDGGCARRRAVRAGERLMRISELETPVLTGDLDAIERNVFRMQAYCDDHGVALRPHIKTHKLPELARLQLEGGSGRDHLSEARRSGGDGRCRLRGHPALVPARRRRRRPSGSPRWRSA